MSRLICLVLMGACISSGAGRQRLHLLPKQAQNAKTGPQVGSQIPRFEATDQNGMRQTFESLRGTKGLVLQFDRSADWCPSCKGALLDLNARAESFRKRGFGVAALTYDSVAVLANFAQRKRIIYTLLSDPESVAIRAFGLLNDNIERGNPAYGIAFPGMFIIDERGVVQAKYFEDDHLERYSAANIISHEFGADGGDQAVYETAHLKFTISATDTSFAPGRRIGLIVDLNLKPGVHIYAPGVEGGYIPIGWNVAESKSWIAYSAAYPQARMLRLPAINEIVPVYQHQVRITRDITIGQEEEIAAALRVNRTLAVDGVLRCQACDEKRCYPPRDVSLQWTFHMERRDTERVPQALQRR